MNLITTKNRLARVAMTLLVALLTTTTAWAQSLSGGGTASDPYVINDATDWATFATAVNNGTTYDGQYVKLSDTFNNSSSAVTDIVGVNGDNNANKSFKGTFDGNNKTLHVNITDTEAQGAAPFRNISGATIKNLTVTGSVTGTTHAAGLVGFTREGTNTIENCVVNVNVSVPATSGNRHMGGVLGHGLNVTVIIRNTVFGGTMSNSGNYAGGFQGWCDGNTLTIENCLFKGSYTGTASNGFHPIAIRNENSTMSYTDNGAYYTASPTLTNNAYIAGAGTMVYATAPANEIYKQLTLVDGNNYYIPCTVTGINESYQYTGSTIDITPTVKDADGTTLTAGTHYAVALTKDGSPVSEVKELGTYTMTITAKSGSGYAGEKTFTFMVKNELTVNDGKATNSYVPVYGFFVDDKSYSQFIIPASELATMQWATINEMTFYGSNTGNNPHWDNAQFEVYMAETTETTLSTLADWDTMTKVMNAAHLEISDGKMVVTLDAPYQYLGGNLMIGIKQTASGKYSSCTWTGVSATGASMGGHGTSVSKQNFLPKTTFEYTPGTAPTCFKPTELTANNVGTNNATLSWNGSSDSYVLQYRTAAHNNMNLWEQVGDDVTTTGKLTQYTFDLSSYSGTGNIAIRHYNVSDLFHLNIDDIVVKNAAGTTIYTEDFEEDGSMPSEITNVDFDGDGYDWYIFSSSGTDENGNPYCNGSHCVQSESYGSSAGALTPDNWLIIPGIELGGQLTLFARGQDPEWAGENFGVFVTTESLETIFATVPAGEWITVDNLTETTYELTGLSAGTKYDWQVKGVCGEGDESLWAISSFTTNPTGFKTFVTAGNWDVAANWSPAGIPTSEDEVIIKAAVTIPAGVIATAKRATLDGGSITIKDGGQLKQGAATLRVTIEKEITGYGEGTGKFSFIASPFSGRTLYEAYDTWNRVDNLLSGNYDLYALDPTHELEWINYDASPSHTAFESNNGNEGLINSEGYLYANAADKTLLFVGNAGKSNNHQETRDVTYDASSTDVFKGWQLIGNQFSCNAYVYFADADGNILPATFYKMNTAGNGLEEVSGNVVVLKPCEGALMLVNASGKIVWSTEPVSGNSEGVDANNVPVLPKHDQSTDQDANTVNDISLVDNDDSGHNSDVIDSYNNQRANVTLSGRTLYRDGYWNTLCVPFALSAEQISASPLAGATIMELDTDDSGFEDGTLTLNFATASDITAGTPYIFKWDNSIDAVTYSGISGSSGFNDGSGNAQSYRYLIDGKNSTKWCAGTSHKDSGKWICEFSSSAPVSVTGYTLTTGNDTKSGNNGNGYANRNPKVWTLEAKVNSNEDWTTIDSRDVSENSGDALPVEDFAEKTYDIATGKQGTYQYFRFVVTATGGDEMQLTELKLLGSIAFNNIANPVFTYVTISDEEHPATIEVSGTKSVVFKGTYDYMSFANEDRSILFLGDENTLYWPQPDGNTYPSIGACRAYFKLNGLSASEINATRLFFGGEDETTGIVSTTDFTDRTDATWFTIDGKKLDKAPTRKGLYIRNGHKVVIK